MENRPHLTKNFNFAPMSLPLRITVDNQDFSYTLLTRIINKETREIKIAIGAEEFTLLKGENDEWYASEASIQDNHQLLQAIIRSIRLRYRI